MKKLLLGLSVATIFCIESFDANSLSFFLKNNQNHAQHSLLTNKLSNVHKPTIKPQNRPITASKPIAKPSNNILSTHNKPTIKPQNRPVTTSKPIAKPSNNILPTQNKSAIKPQNRPVTASKPIAKPSSNILPTHNKPIIKPQNRPVTASKPIAKPSSNILPTHNKPIIKPQNRPVTASKPIAKPSNTILPTHNKPIIKPQNRPVTASKPIAKPSSNILPTHNKPIVKPQNRPVTASKPIIASNLNQNSSLEIPAKNSYMPYVKFHGAFEKNPREKRPSYDEIIFSAKKSGILDSKGQLSGGQLSKVFKNQDKHLIFNWSELLNSPKGADKRLLKEILDEKNSNKKWAKMKSDKFTFGKFVGELHFYMNTATKQIYTGRDFKIKVNTIQDAQSFWKNQKTHANLNRQKKRSASV